MWRRAAKPMNLCHSRLCNSASMQGAIKIPPRTKTAKSKNFQPNRIRSIKSPDKTQSELLPQNSTCADGIFQSLEYKDFICCILKSRYRDISNCYRYKYT